MTTVRESIRRLFTPVQPLAPGIYHYQAPIEDPRNYRLHLRVEAGGDGVLIVNASTVLHLNPTATEYAYYLVQGASKDQVARNVSARYRVSQGQALRDYHEFIERIDTLISAPDLDPEMYLDFERQKPYSAELSAPYRLDCAVTYRLPAQVDVEAAPFRRVTRELSTQEWENIFDKAWNAGIPHILLTGGEPTLREDLVELIAHAESNGQVTGLLTDGIRLADAAYLKTILLSGLDHLMIIVQPDEPSFWTAVRNTLQGDIFTAVHLTITHENKAQAIALLNRLAEVGVRAVSLSTSTVEIEEDLQQARGAAANLGLSLIWNLPVPYSALNPVSLEIESFEQPQGAGHAWLYVEPDGDVFPAQGYTKSLGNLNQDAWDSIWEATKILKERV